MSSSIWQMTMPSVIYESGFLKQATRRAVWRGQYTGSAARLRTANRRLSRPTFPVMAMAFIDRALYLPKEWTDDPDRLQATYVPAARALRPNQLATE